MDHGVSVRFALWSCAHSMNTINIKCEHCVPYYFRKIQIMFIRSFFEAFIYGIKMWLTLHCQGDDILRKKRLVELDKK